MHERWSVHSVHDIIDISCIHIHIVCSKFHPYRRSANEVNQYRGCMYYSEHLLLSRSLLQVYVQTGNLPSSFWEVSQLHSPRVNVEDNLA